MLLVLVTRLVFDNPFIAITVAAVWFALIVASGLQYESGLSFGLSLASVGLAYVAWVIIATILGRGLI